MTDTVCVKILKYCYIDEFDDLDDYYSKLIMSSITDWTTISLDEYNKLRDDMSYLKNFFPKKQDKYALIVKNDTSDLFMTYDGMVKALQQAKEEEELKKQKIKAKQARAAITRKKKIEEKERQEYEKLKAKFGDK